MSSAKRQNKTLFRKWAASCGSTPRPRTPSAILANLRAASSVTPSTVRPGLNTPGSSNSARKTRRFSASGNAALSKRYTRLTVPVKLVWTS